MREPRNQITVKPHAGMFKKGDDPRRAKGRRTGSRDVRTTCEEDLIRAGVQPEDIVMRMAAIAMNEEHPRNFDALKELLDRIHAKKKHTEVAIDPEKARIEIVVKRWGE